MLECAVDHVGHRLKPAVRVPGRALGLAGRILDLAHLVEMDERVEQVEVDAGERAPHRKAFAFQAAGRAGDGYDWAR